MADRDESEEDPELPIINRSSVGCPEPIITWQITTDSHHYYHHLILDQVWWPAITKPPLLFFALTVTN